jgi:thioredoxin 1|tara:strand:+ start:305 stop:742 length:438 start_codon:yes stop_codon:yes gene_type:complete
MMTWVGLKNPSRWQLDMAVVDVTEPEFAGIIENNELVILDFWAEWCGPCKAYGPVFKRVSEDHPEVVFAKIDTDQEQALSESFGIRSIPTTIAFKQGIGVFMMPGALPEKDLRELVTKLNEIDMDEVRAQIAADEKAGEAGEDSQ